LTGNNVTFRGDLGRRIVPCDLDPKCEYPEDRDDFHYPKLIQHVKQERSKLVAAALTILRAFHQAGRPGHGKPLMGSFEEWDELVRAAAISAGLSDPLDTILRIREEGDSDRERLLAGLRGLAAAFGTEPFKTSEAVDRAKGGQGQGATADADLRVTLCEFVGCEESKLDSRRLGIALRHVRGRVADGMYFDKVERDSHAKVSFWRVAKHEDPGCGVCV